MTPQNYPMFIRVADTPDHDLLVIGWMPTEDAPRGFHDPVVVTAAATPQTGLFCAARRIQGTYQIVGWQR